MTRETELLDVAEARRRLLEYFTTVAGETVPLASCVGRILAEPVYTQFDLPPFSNSSMDGFAVRAADVASAGEARPVTLAVVADLRAGWNSDTGVRDGQAARIMTGAPLPPGADAVVRVEDTDFTRRDPGTSAPEKVNILAAVKPGENVRHAGDDLKRGALAIDAGRRLRPQDAGFLSMLGVAQVAVRRRPRAAIFSTGDELLPVDAPLTPGKIHDANSYTLVGLVEHSGGEAINLGIVEDHPDAVRRTLVQAMEAGVDVILSSAGVSVGAFDFVRSVVEQEGSLTFWRVNMRPGKPVAFGNYRGIPFIGLPGNPVSAYVGYYVFVRPAFRKMLGAGGVENRARTATLIDDIDSDGREAYLRCIVRWEDGELKAGLTGHQGSGNLHSLVQANALLFVPSRVKYLPSGERVEVFLFDDPFS